MDDLKIVCLHFRGSEPVKEGKVRESAGEGTPYPVKQGKGKKGKSKGILSWDKDRKKGKGKKNEAQERDWIPGFGLKPKDKGRGRKEKEREEAVSKDLVSDPKSREGRIPVASTEEHGKSTEPSPLDERITFARGSDLTSTDEDRGMEEEGEDEGGIKTPLLPMRTTRNLPCLMPSRSLDPRTHTSRRAARPWGRYRTLDHCLHRTECRM